MRSSAGISLNAEVSALYSANIPCQLRRNHDRDKPHGTIMLTPVLAGVTHDAMRALDRNELEALTLFANGRSAEEIATGLKVSQSMAHHYLRVAARKLGARNRVHAVAIAVRKGLVHVAGGEE
jgi:DNA-binding CsgD family transcriptional regulator